MRKATQYPLLFLIAIALLMIAPLQAQRTVEAVERSDEAIIEDLRSELSSLTDFTVFDHVAFKYQNGHVTLVGHVTRPYLSENAASAASVVRGVTGVTNEIEVLPPSFADDRLRMQVYQAIYRNSPLQRYANQPVPSIRIIVNMGRVELHGVVDNEGDRTIAEMQARRVPQVLSVENEIQLLDEAAD
jgi:osmotically-inducible protein OsmY